MEAGSSIPPSHVGDQTKSARNLFKGISLEETNNTSAMLSRIDQKFILPRARLEQILDGMQNHYRILTIDSQTHFSYRSCYYDDAYRCYFEHHQGRRQRFKVRTREYVDTGDIFFEVKLKGSRGQTHKHRKLTTEFQAPMLTDEQQATVSDLYTKFYRKGFNYRLSTTLLVNYKRFTLVSNTGGERITIDTSINYNTPDNNNPGGFGDGVAVVECKSSAGSSIFKNVLLQHGFRPEQRCSKYCIGLVLAGEVARCNNFKPTLKKMREYA